MLRVLKFNVLSLFRVFRLRRISLWLTCFGFQVFILLVVFGVGCGKTDQKLTVHATSTVSLQNVAAVDSKMPGIPSPEVNSFQPFYIYTEKGSRQNHYIPSGFMPNGKCLSLDDAWTQNCHTGKSCIQVQYDVNCSRKDQRWAGIYWLNPANNWGQRKGGFDLTGAQKLTFWARGQEGKEQIQEFTVGGITGNYPDSDVAVMGPALLSAEWRQYTIDLRGKDLSSISGGFAWSTNEEVNPQSCTFYLDEIRFE